MLRKTIIPLFTLLSFILLSGCFSTPASKTADIKSVTDKTSAERPEALIKVNRLVREGVSVSIPEGWFFTYPDKPGITAGFYSPDKTFTGTLEYCDNELELDKKNLEAVLENFQNRATGSVKNEIWQLEGNSESEAVYAYYILFNSLYCIKQKGSALFGLWLKTESGSTEELVSLARAILSEIDIIEEFTQQRIIENKASVISLDRSWSWYSDINDGFIFSSAAGDIPLCISIAMPEQLSASDNTPPGKNSSQMFICNQMLKINYQEVILDSARHLYIDAVIRERPAAIHISTTLDAVKSAEELLSHELVKNFFMYNVVF